MHRLLLILFVLLSFTGCASKRIEFSTVRHFDQEAIRLSNGTAEVVVIPSLGRIIRFSFVGEQNVLWENPLAVDTAKLNGGWENWGGDKVWLWPQAEWQTLIGKTWPPPADPPAKPIAIRHENQKLTITSSPIEPLGLRIIREIELDGANLRVISRLEPEDLARRMKLRPWAVTQLMVPEQIHVDLIDGNVKTPFAPMSGQSPWPEIQRSRDSVTLVRPADVGAKTGLEADSLIATYPRLRFSQKLITPADARYALCERAQVYSDPDRSPFRQPALPPYIEFEFVAPKDSARVEVIWKLDRR